MTDITGLREDKRPQSSRIVHALLDRLEAAEKERDALRVDKATLQQMLYSIKNRLEAAEKYSAHHKALAESALRVAKGWEGKRDALRAKIEAMERQEPAAEWLPLDSGEDTRSNLK